MVGADGSASGGAALRWAVREAVARGVPLTVVHAWVQTWNDPSRHLHAQEPAAGHAVTVGEGDDVEPHQAATGPAGADAEFARRLAFVRSLVEDAVDAVDGLDGLEVVPRQVHGWPAPALLQVARETDAAMVVVGRTGAGRLGRLILGSVSASVVQDATLPVTVVPGDGDDPAAPPAARRVVVGVDGSTASVAALREGARVVAHAGGVLEAVVCWQLTTTARPPEGHGWVPPVDDFADWARTRLEATIARAADEGPGLAVPADDVVREVRHARPAAGLAEVCRGADRVVVGDRGTGGLERLVLGSVSRQLLEAAPCPVTVVRA
ncbi:nucleotide-binding universal stress UspA family protein [Luteimicrobium subarcticum]|uniref:Nucleotide-binding universal stress UspA family protein n=1 Tax=Luteimicrobium subarcticum TaxID=620910 RepID=A0A2M8WVY3_9MICO|nr:nucleotide-binding universal stress UspA family protein [Luteimicrobium subarcticum]